jgi:hypothetical protein
MGRGEGSQHDGKSTVYDGGGMMLVIHARMVYEEEAAQLQKSMVAWQCVRVIVKAISRVP